ncbi:BgTH12-07327 [Blumeria graminis f. sp. triticale]|uniref:BgTH12-07327 n=1 Tax=Blumeria graminis f. sp. triticale TaxID=1689686 RepID=A0A9W4D951_BLUGR|nr:BgTH12-07327 [Blumeria graminis f. sp. triticale]
MFTILLLSAPASSMTNRIKVTSEPGYHCGYKIYPHSEVETTRLIACRGFTAARSNARRPVLHFGDIKVENMIFEWSFPSVVTLDPRGKKRRYADKITFDNSCELKDLLYYDYTLDQFKPCINVPEVSTSTTSGIGQVLIEPLVKCGSLSWEITEIQKHARDQLYQSLHSFDEVEDTSSRVDGPWKKPFLSKKMNVDGKGENKRYQIILNNQNEVRGIVIMHNINLKTFATRKIIQKSSKQQKLTPTREKKIITLECLLDEAFPLFPSGQIWDLPSPKRRKTLE